MIGRLVGRVVSEEPTGALVLDVHGVGYELACPVGTGSKAQRTSSSVIRPLEDTPAFEKDQSEIIIHVHTNLRQDAIELYGFCTPQEREAFRQLTSVPNVGPRLAIAVLNVLPAHQLAACIDSEDKARIVKVPGVGKKTAERLILELRGKLSVPTSSDEASPKETSSPRPGHLNDQLIVALTGLGYKKAEAEKAAEALLKSEDHNENLSLLLRAALDYLAP